MSRKQLLGAMLLGFFVVSCVPVSKKALAYQADTNEQKANIDNDSIQNDYELPCLRENSDEIILRRKGYTVSYNPSTKLPNWVAWHLTAEHVSGTNQRKGMAFHEDEDVPEPRVNTYDYARSGYDRGHMCPAADNKWDALAMEQSFLMTNVCPQDHVLNIGDWNNLETQCRQWAVQYGDLYIVCGPILYKGKHKTIGKHKVVVPEAFFKVLLRTGNSPQAIGFVYRNNDKRHPWGDYVNSIDEVERITGFDFFAELPDSVENVVEQKVNIDEWPMQALH